MVTYVLRQDALNLKTVKHTFSRLEADGSATLLARSHTKFAQLKEKVSFFADEAATDLVFTVGARTIIELAGVYDVRAADGTDLAVIAKDVRASLLRSTFTVTCQDGRALTVTEPGELKPLARRAWNVLGPELLPWPFPIEFATVEQSADGPLLSVRRERKVRDHYAVTADPSLDWRIVAATTYAVDYYMGR